MGNRPYKHGRHVARRLACSNSSYCNSKISSANVTNNVTLITRNDRLSMSWRRQITYRFKEGRRLALVNIFFQVVRLSRSLRWYYLFICLFVYYLSRNAPLFAKCLLKRFIFCLLLLFFFKSLLQAEVEETLQRIEAHGSVAGTIVANADGKTKHAHTDIQKTNVIALFTYFYFVLLHVTQRG